MRPRVRPGAGATQRRRQGRRQLPRVAAGPRRDVRAGHRRDCQRGPRQHVAAAAGPGDRLRPSGPADRLYGRGRHCRRIQRQPSSRRPLQAGAVGTGQTVRSVGCQRLSTRTRRANARRSPPAPLFGILCPKSPLCLLLLVSRPLSYVNRRSVESLPIGVLRVGGRPMFASRYGFGLLALVFAMGLCLCADPAEAAAPKKPKPKTPPKVAQNQFKVPTTPLNGNVKPDGTTTPTTTTGTTAKGDTSKAADTKTVDKEVDYDIADDAKVQKLHKFDTGLNFVEAKIDELMEGHKVNLSLVGKGKKKDVVHVSGTVVKFSDKKVTLKMTVPEKQDVPGGDGKQATLVSIRSLDKDK